MAELQNANHIAVDPDFITDAIAELPFYLQTKENTVKIAQWYATRWKRLDDEVVKLGFMRLLDNATGVLLDNIGEKINLDRNQLSDSAYRSLIKFRSLRQRTNGTRNDVAFLLRSLFFGTVPYIYKGRDGFVEITAINSCLNNEILVEQMNDILPIDSYIWFKTHNSAPFVLVDKKNNLQPEGTGCFSDKKVVRRSNTLTRWIYSSAKTIRV